jgi:hypothetical protein
MIRPRQLVAATLGLVLVCGGSLLATGCSSDKTSSAASTEIISTEPTAAVTLEDDTSLASQEGSPSDSTLLEPSIAVGEPNGTAEPGDSADSVEATDLPADTTASGDTQPASVASGPGELTDEQLKSAFEAMGIAAAPEKLTCVKEKAGKSIDMSAPEPPPEFLRALMFCVPASLVDANTQKLSESAEKSGATVADAGCFQTKTFETMAALDIATFTTLLNANAPIDFPAEIKAKIKEATKECALTDAQFASLLEG